MAWTSKLSLVACATIIILALFTAYDLNGQSFDFSDKHLVLVVSDSMDGDVVEYDINSFPAYSLVMVENLSPYERQFLRIGDVVSYYDNGTQVIHRVVQINDGNVYVHGDNNHSTEIVKLEDINGRAIGTSSLLGHALALVSGNFIAFLVVMFVISAAIVIYGVYRSEPKEAAE